MRVGLPVSQIVRLVLERLGASALRTVRPGRGVRRCPGVDMIDLCTEIRPVDPYERAVAMGHRQYGLGGWCDRGPNRPEEWADNECLIGWLRSCDSGHLVCPPGAEDLTLEDLRGWAWSCPNYHPWGLLSRYGWLRDANLQRRRRG